MTYSSFMLYIDYIHPLSSAMMLLKHLFCVKVALPSVERNGCPQPRVFQKDCAFDDCATCSAHFKSGDCVMQCPTIFSDTVIYRWREYGQVLLDNGKYLTELKETSGNLGRFRKKFMQVLSRYKRHYYKYTFLNHVRKAEIDAMEYDDVLIFVDFSAQPTLDPQDKLNCQGHGVCVLECILVLYNARDEFYEVDGKRVKYRHYDCKHVRVVSPSTGKQKDQDWFMHCHVLRELVRGLVRERPSRRNFSIWSDGAPNQYKCRQNIYWLTVLANELNIRISHRFGATAQFKGVHDKIGQVAKWTVR